MPSKTKLCDASQPHGDISFVDLLACAGVEPAHQSRWWAGDGRACDVRITSLTDDSRCVTPGACFVAVRGTSVDGHTRVDDAVRAGASAIVVNRDVSGDRPAVTLPPGVAVVCVDDSRMALAKLAAVYFGLVDAGGPPLHLAGITGTNGKTTVAWMLRSILQAAGRNAALLGTIEHDLVGRRVEAALTTPGALEMSRLLAEARGHGATHAVLEASSHALEQKRCDGLAFDVCVFTNLSGDHLDYHGTMTRYAEAKRHLFDLRCGGAPAVVNADDPMGRSLARELEGPVLTYGLEGTETDVGATVESTNVEGSRFRLRTPKADETIHMSLVGRHNVSNALAAASAAEALGIGARPIREGLEALSSVPGRLERVELTTPACPAPTDAFTVVVDYAHTDAALASALDAMQRITEGRLICVFGCGGERDRSKRPRMAAVVERFADVAFVTSDNPRHENPCAIVEEILTGFDSKVTGEALRHRSGPRPCETGLPGCRVEVEVDRRRAIEAAMKEACSGDTVLIAGKGHETYQLVGGRVLAFDDVAVARSASQRCRMYSSPVGEAVSPVAEEVT